jgi:hypothetical protein
MDLGNEVLINLQKLRKSDWKLRNQFSFALKQLLLNAGGKKWWGSCFNQAPQPSNFRRHDALRSRAASHPASHVRELISTAFQKMHFSQFKRSGVVWQAN